MCLVDDSENVIRPLHGVRDESRVLDDEDLVLQEHVSRRNHIVDSWLPEDLTQLLLDSGKPGQR